MIRAVFFDLDETLCDFTGSEMAAREQICRDVSRLLNLPLEDVLKTYGDVSCDSVERYEREGLFGKGSVFEFRSETWGETLKKLGVEDENLAARLSKRHESIRLRRYLKLFPDVRQALDALSGRCPLGLISNGFRDVQRAEVEALGIGRFFEVMLFEGELGFGKPDRRIFDLALSKVGCAPEESIFVGDSPEIDVAGARGAGWWAVLLNRRGKSYHTTPEREGAGDPNFEVSNLVEFVEIVKKLDRGG
ncbi:MAG: HAD family hydrolase [bacterium]